MARSLLNVKLFSAVVADGISNAIYRRGFASAAASQGTVARGTAPRSAAMMKKSGKEEATEKVSWVPDPVTGVYKPENVADEIDVADLRAIFLKPKH